MMQSFTIILKSRSLLRCSKPRGGAAADLLLADESVLHEHTFAAYLQLQHARRAEYGRAQRWMCSWLYKLRACDDAERAQRTQPVPLGRGR